MKFIIELLKLNEEAIPIVKAEDLWSENSSSAEQYITGNLYRVKAVKGSFEVYLDKDGKRTLVGKMSQQKLDQQYTPVRGNQKSDAEGFITYRDAAEYEAFKYNGDTTKVELSDGTTAKISKGDFILRQSDADDFIYTVETSKYFDQNYSKKS